MNHQQLSDLERSALCCSLDSYIFPVLKYKYKTFQVYQSAGQADLNKGFYYIFLSDYLIGAFRVQNENVTFYNESSLIQKLEEGGYDVH